MQSSITAGSLDRRHCLVLWSRIKRCRRKTRDESRETHPRFAKAILRSCRTITALTPCLYAMEMMVFIDAFHLSIRTIVVGFSPVDVRGNNRCKRREKRKCRLNVVLHKLSVRKHDFRDFTWMFVLKGMVRSKINYFHHLLNLMSFQTCMTRTIFRELSEWFLCSYSGSSTFFTISSFVFFGWKRFGMTWVNYDCIFISVSELCLYCDKRESIIGVIMLDVQLT